MKTILTIILLGAICLLEVDLKCTNDSGKFTVEYNGIYHVLNNRDQIANGDTVKLKPFFTTTIKNSTISTITL